MNDQLAGLLNNTTTVFLTQAALFSLPPFYFALLHKPLRSAVFYIYLSMLLVLAGFLGAVYALPLTESITVSGGDLAYGALMYATILLVLIEADVYVIRAVIRLIVLASVFLYVLFAALSWTLSLEGIVNPVGAVPDLFSLSAGYAILGVTLFIAEMLILLFLFEKIKLRVKPVYALSVLYTVCFVAVLCLHGMLFQLFDFAFAGVDAGELTGKFVTAVAFGLPILVFLLVYRRRLAAYYAAPIRLSEIWTWELAETQTDLTEQKQVELQMVERNRFIETVLDNLPIGLSVNLIDSGATSYMNAEFENIYGWPLEKLSDIRQFFELVYPDPAYRQHIQDQILADMESGDVARMSWEGVEITTESGEKRIVSAKNIPLYEENLMISTVQDITARRQAEKQLQSYTQRLEALRQIDHAILAQDSPERIAEATIDHLAKLVDCDRISAGRIDEAGEMATVLAVYQREKTELRQGETMSVGEHAAIMAELRRGQTQMFRDLKQFAGHSSTADILLQEGLRSYMTVPLIAADRLIGSLSLGSKHVDQFDENHEMLVKEVAYHLAIALQQAYLHEAEKTQRNLAETLQQTAVTLVGSLNLAETLSTILEQLALVVQYDLAQVLLIRGELLTVGARQGSLANEAVAGGERPYTQIPLLNQSLQTGNPLRLSGAQLKKNHLHLPGMAPALSSWVGVPLIARDVAVGFLTVGKIAPTYLSQEVSAIKAFAQQAALAVEKATILSELEKNVQSLRETQAQMIRAARLAAIGETAAGIAHQINNPLTTVILDSHLLLKNLPDPHPAHQSAAAIHQAALRAAGVVKRLLDFSLTKPTTKEPINISHSIEESVTLLKAQLPENVLLQLELAPNLPFVLASPEHLQDVWLNLLINARDAVRQLEKGIIRVTVIHNRRLKMVEVAVQDNGAGIPPDQQKKIFDPFYTTKLQGTGLGLAVCQDIIMHHGGEIRLSSADGLGSTFTVSLPIVIAE